MLIKRLISISLFLLFCVSPIAAQSRLPKENIIKPFPKQDRTVTSGPAKIGQQYQKTDDQQKNSKNPEIKVNEIKSPVVYQFDFLGD